MLRPKTKLQRRDRLGKYTVSGRYIPVQYHVRTRTKQESRTDHVEGKLHGIDLLAAPLQHLTVNQQQRVASETTDERAA